MIKELEKLDKKAFNYTNVSKGVNTTFVSELEVFFCNCNLDSKQRVDLINIINKYFLESK